MNVNRELIAERVRRAQAGDVGAWATIVEEFQDVAAGLAASWSGDWSISEDVAQDAFVTAFLHLQELVDPQAFPAWFMRVVRSATTRHLRRERRGFLASSSNGGDVVDPADSVVSNDESRRLRGAVESLPAHERAVIALHYLADLPYAEVAELLGISVSAAKKRSFSARRHLEELLPMSLDALSSSRPSRNHRLRDAVALFLGIRQRNHELVRGLLARDPSLVSATEAWSKDEAMELGLQNAEDGTPLVRAVQTGDLELVTLLLDAGTPVGQRCQCAGSESALWTAALYGETAIVEVLLAAGADPDASAFTGATPLAVASQRGHGDIMRLLLAAGAAPAPGDQEGCSAVDSSTLRDGPSRKRGDGDLVATGVRALDLFAPILRGTIQWWPAAWELGQFALLTEIVRSIRPSEFWQLGFATGSYNAESGRQWQRQFPVGTHLRLTPYATSSGDRRANFESSVNELISSRHDKIVMLLTAPGHHHDITVAVAQLARDSSVLTTIVIEPATTDVTVTRAVPPEGFDAQVSFDASRAVRQLWPAVDPLRTTAAVYPSARHKQIASCARDVLEQYRVVDPDLQMHEPDDYSDALLAARAHALHRYFTQPFKLWEHVTSVCGVSTPYDELLDAVETILASS